jgi:hypothetical protein
VRLDALREGRNTIVEEEEILRPPRRRLPDCLVGGGIADVVADIQGEETRLVLREECG